MTPEQKQRIEQIRDWKRTWLALEGYAPKGFKKDALDHVDFLLSLVKSQEEGGDEARECSCHKFIHLHDGNCSVHGFVHKQEPPRLEWEYCPSCAGQLDTGYECAKCGRDWQSYVHDATLRIDTETEQ